MWLRMLFFREMRSVRCDSPANCGYEHPYCQETLSVLLAGSRIVKMICRLYMTLDRIQDFVIEVVINF